MISSSDKEIPVDNISHPIPFIRRVTRSMMEKRFQIVQEDITLVLTEDNSPDRELDPQLDLYWIEEAEKFYDQYSHPYKSPIQDPLKCSFEDPIIPQQEPSEENISSPTGAETHQENSKLQRKVSRLRREAKENRVLIRFMQEENNSYKEQNVKQQSVIEKWQRKYIKAKFRTSYWTKKFKFQKAKVIVLKKKIKVLQEQTSSSGTRLNILANAITLC